jgi:hypothetical protein
MDFGAISQNFFRGRASLHWSLMPLVRRIILALLTLALALPVAAGQGMVICVGESHLAVELDHADCGGAEESEPHTGATLSESHGSCTDVSISGVLNASRTGTSLATHQAAIATIAPQFHVNVVQSSGPAESLAASPPLPDLLPLSTIVLRV